MILVVPDVLLSVILTSVSPCIILGKFAPSTTLLISSSTYFLFGISFTSVSNASYPALITLNVPAPPGSK